MDQSSIPPSVPLPPSLLPPVLPLCTLSSRVSGRGPSLAGCDPPPLLFVSKFPENELEAYPLLPHSCSHNAAAGAVTASINIVLMFWWLEPRQPSSIFDMRRKLPSIQQIPVESSVSGVGDHHRGEF
ncbi:unnamed protein product [Pleuronectes platessa]|uniref:Uncharacterized protein n=1 Tax=Pleuronectes platessa TaxID=8262 RepID=A0A9N7VAB7_PLEPL|nr:unnamed protein product [Pleuronectes platessa]